MWNIGGPLVLNCMGIYLRVVLTMTEYGLDYQNLTHGDTSDPRHHMVCLENWPYRIWHAD